MHALIASPVATGTAVAFDHVSLAFDDNVVLRDVSFSVAPGATTVLLGPSGSGKSVILKLILGLLKPDSGTIAINGVRTDRLNETELIAVRAGIGMLFQENALFDSLSVADNVGYRLAEEMHMAPAAVRARVEEVLGFIGLQEYIDAMPSDLSGGQRRRVAIARAIAARPQLVLFDDPTSGLDPLTAKAVDDEIIKLRDLEQVTSLVVTHQLPDAVYIVSHQAVRTGGRVAIGPAGQRAADRARFIVLKDARIFFQGSLSELCASRDPYLHTLLEGWVPPLVP